MQLFRIIAQKQYESMHGFSKTVFSLAGGCLGWFVAEFRPTFPLMIVAVIFIVYDAYTAYHLAKRVSEKYPEQAKGGKFNSDDFAKVIKSTIPSRLMAIILAFLVERWVFIGLDVPLSYIVTGVICFEQAWSILENESSCRTENESMFWKILQKIMIDKTARHLNMTADELKAAIDNTNKNE